MPPADLVIRAATTADRGALIRLLTAQLREHDVPIDEDGVARGVELALTHGSSAWLVIALSNGLPAGVLLANPIVSVEKGGASLWIEELYVPPEKRRRGVARALLEFIREEARNHGLRALELQVEPSHEPALALYRSLGFETNQRVSHVLALALAARRHLSVAALAARGALSVPFARMRTLSGIQSSGRLHLGNYYGAIRQWVQLQEEGEALYFIANLHSLTSVRDARLQAELTFDVAVALLSFGLDPARAILFRQSDIPEITELFWILGTLVPMSNLERAHSYKDKIQNNIAPNFGLFAYPVLMAADILLYGSDVVPVGKDQVQHIEFARDWATKFNVEYVKGYDPQDPGGLKSGKPGILKLPEARLQESTAVVPGIDGRKMSKSYGNTIDLFGEEKEVKKQIMGIKTDSTPVPDPKPLEPNEAGFLPPLYSLLKLAAPPAEWEAIDASWRAGGTGYGDYKKRLLEYFHAQFGAARTRRAELLKDPAEVEAILKQGAEKARAVAAPYMKAVRQAVGLPG